jgi:DNA-binding response OmpR family regulator
MLAEYSRCDTGAVRILLVEDDFQLPAATARGLRNSGFAVDVADRGEDALAKTAVTEYDVVVLDRDLPGMHGDDVCRSIAAGSARILMLTAFDSLDDRVAWLGLGADDYLVKPFHLRELLARIHALGRRPAQSAAPVLEVGDCRLDPHQRVVHRANRVISLTPKEFGVLEVLMKQSPAPVSAELLLEKVWGEHADPFTNAVRVTMVTLRRKLGAPPLIETVKSVGYRVTAR